MSAALRSPRRFLRSHLPFAGIAIALVILASITVVSLSSINRFQEQTGWVDHTYQVLSGLEKVLTELKDARSAARSYVISGDENLLPVYEDTKRDIREQLDTLRSLTTDNAEQSLNVAKLQTLIGRVLMTLDGEVTRRQDGTDAASAFLYLASANAQAILDPVRTQVALMKKGENILLAERAYDADQSARHTRLVILMGTVIALLMLIVGFLLLVREMRRRERADRIVLETNEALHQHARQLEITNKELESFSYSVSHDLRIPLRAISGFVRMLEEDYAAQLDEEGQRLLKVVRDNSTRMGELIDDLLTFSRLGRKPITTTEVDMNRLVETAVNDMARRDMPPRAQFLIDPLPPCRGDRILLQQVWINLISNAVKYSEKKDSPAVRVSAQQADGETVYSVSDNGVGFDMKYYDKLFGVFQRLHSADEFSGTGVGLAIVQRIVVRLGGRVWAESELGKGAAFHFALPL